MNNLSEEAMCFQEGHIPELAEGAVMQAYCKALASGNTIVEAVNGQLMEFYPDGSSRLIKTLPTATPVVPGQRRVRRR
jgi:hypothetical protein